MKTYDTVCEAINDLKERGFELDLNIEFDKQIRKDDVLNPDEYEIIETYRFEGNSDPDDEDIIYAMCSKSTEKKGIFTGAFGLYANSDSFNLIRNISDFKNG